MYFKCLDNQGNWHWIADVTTISKYSSLDDIPNYHGEPQTEKIGLPTERSTHPHVIKLHSPKGENIYEFFGTKGYLCNDETGATLDTVIVS
jgi:hypothetical protein